LYNAFIKTKLKPYLYEKILLVGKQLTHVPPANELVIKDAEYFAAPDLLKVQEVFKKNKTMSAGKRHLLKKEQGNIKGIILFNFLS
jgi:hypothetical protein